MAILTLVSASGVGKGALMKELFRQLPDRIHLLTSTTTRAPDARDLKWNRPDSELTENEYEYVSEERFINMLEKGLFLQEFGGYGTRYGTNAQLFDFALRSQGIYLAALFTPAVELFWNRAQETAFKKNIYPLFLDLPSEEERHTRLVGRGEKNLKRFEPELERRRHEAQNSPVPFFSLMATEPPRTLAVKVRHEFNF